MRSLHLFALLASVCGDYELGDYDLNDCASVGSARITTEEGCNAAKDWVLQNAQAKLKLETDENYPKGCYLHDTSKDHGVFIFNDHLSGKGNALSRTICQLKKDQKEEASEKETSEKIKQAEKKQVRKTVVQLDATHERSLPTKEGHTMKSSGKATDLVAALNPHPAKHLSYHASKHTASRDDAKRSTSKHHIKRNARREEHVQLTDAFGNEFTHRAAKRAASQRESVTSDTDDSDDTDDTDDIYDTEDTDDTPVLTHSENQTLSHDALHARQHTKSKDAPKESLLDTVSDSTTKRSTTAVKFADKPARKHEHSKSMEVNSDDTPAGQHETGKTVDTKRVDKPVSKGEAVRALLDVKNDHYSESDDGSASKHGSDKTADVKQHDKPANKHDIRITASAHDDKSPVAADASKKVQPVRFAIHSHDLTFAASKNGAVWRGKLGGGTTPLLEWVADDGANMSLFAEPFRRKDIHEGWVERIIMVRNQARVLSVMTRKSGFGSIEVLLDNKEISHPTPLGATNTYESPSGLKLWTSKRQQKRFMIGEYHADWLTVVAGGLKMIVYSSAAEEVPEQADASHYMHLNIDIESTVPNDAQGFLAELAGVRPLSAMTKMLLETPNKKVTKKRSGGAQRALQAE